ncbi:MAG: GMC family oxidoreductase N-terminal domain-containing protein, partial [Rhodospirillaceae bacterium]
YRLKGRDVEARAGKEVILSAGSVQSPQLLELSGIGRPDVLKPLGIEVRHELMGVGENLQDHYTSRLVWRVKNARTLNEQAHGLRLVGEAIKFATQGRGALTMSAGVVAGFVRSRPELEVPDIQYHIAHASFDDPKRRILHKFPGLTFAPLQLRPESRGSIHIKSADPVAPPAIVQNFLSTETDRQVHLAGQKIARDSVNTEAMKPYIVEE